MVLRKRKNWILDPSQREAVLRGQRAPEMRGAETLGGFAEQVEPAQPGGPPKITLLPVRPSGPAPIRLWVSQDRPGYASATVPEKSRWLS